MAEKWEERLARKKGVVCLPYNVQVIIPYKCKPRCMDAYRDLLAKMTKLFGGATVYTADGYWINPEGKLVPDAVKVIESAHSCMDDETERKFVKAVLDAARLAKQDAISIKTGKFLIVPTKVKG